MLPFGPAVDAPVDRAVVSHVRPNAKSVLRLEVRPGVPREPGPEFPDDLGVPERADVA